MSSIYHDQHNLIGKYLTFSLGDEIYGIDILKVIEIIGVMHITKVPRTEKCIKGVINLRGKVIPLVDLRLKLGMQEIPYNQRTCTIIVKVVVEDHEVALGMIVDTVLEVVDIQQQDLLPAPEISDYIDKFVLGMAKINKDNRVMILIDINEVLSVKEAVNAKEIAEEEVVHK